MAIPHLHRLVRALCLAAVAGGAGCTIYPASPSDPVYETDVRPIFLAHCTRCHGDGPDGGHLNTVPGASQTGNNPAACFTQYGVNPSAHPPGCQYGAAYDATGVNNSALYMNIHSSDPTAEMPPPPAPRLNSYELGVIDAWLGENPPKCSNSPNPDPALFCTAGSFP